MKLSYKFDEAIPNIYENIILVSDYGNVNNFLSVTVVHTSNF